MPAAKVAKTGKQYASVVRGGSGINIRYEPSLNAEVLRTVPAGFPFQVLKRQGDWVLVDDYRGKKGWVFTSLLTEPGTVIVNVWKGNLRSGPSTKERIITKLNHGTVLSVVETRGEWLKVSDATGVSGWLSRDIVWPGDYEVPGVAETEEASAPVPAEAAQPVQAPEQAAAEEAAVPAAKVAKTGKQYASVVRGGSGINIRYEPSLNAEVLRTVPAGFPFQVLKRQGDWVLVDDYRGKKGWVFTSLLTEPGTVIVNVWKGNLRSGPSTKERIITKLNHGTVLSVVETRGEWLKVSDATGVSGWLSRDIVWPGDYEVPGVAETEEASAPVPAEAEPSAPSVEQPAKEEVAPPAAVEKQAPVAAPVPETEAETVKEEAAQPAQGKLPPPAITEQVQTLETSKPGAYASVAMMGSGANIHPEPSMSSEILRAFPPGYPVVILERRGDWVLVDDFRDRKGWVYSSLLTKPETVIIKVLKGYIRIGPNIRDKIIAKLDQGTVLSVVEIRGDWLKVSDTTGLNGWLHRDVVWP